MHFVPKDITQQFFIGDIRTALQPFSVEFSHLPLKSSIEATVMLHVSYVSRE